MVHPDAAQERHGWGSENDPAEDTIALLQEEIARLEDELRVREDAGRFPPGDGPDPEAPASGERLQLKVNDLVSELAARDEMVEILTEQSRLLEESAHAREAEWEQLGQWVEDVERSFEEKESNDLRLQDELESERRGAAAERRAFEARRREWEERQRKLEKTVEQLRSNPDGRLDNSSRDHLPDALVEENKRLRDRLDREQEKDAEAEELRRRLEAASRAHEQARVELQQVIDERQEDRNRYETTLRELRSEAARASAPLEVRHPDSGGGKDDASTADGTSDWEDRIRVLREHLNEIHSHECEHRSRRSLSGRLSRLWRHTHPGR